VDCIEEDNSNISFNMNMSETELNQFLFWKKKAKLMKKNIKK
jgi:hypothetical protein